MCAKRKHVGSQSVPLSVISDCQPSSIRLSHAGLGELGVEHTEPLTLTTKAFYG